jgi:ribonuclease HII
MKTLPTYNLELYLKNKGYKYIIGIDEAGRGGLALGVVAAAVNIPDGFDTTGINDSKKLSSKKRELFYNNIISGCDYAISYVDEKIIDSINILNATKLAMRQCVYKMMKSDFVLVDGNFRIDSIDIDQISIIKGDTLVVSISAASILAKHYRDALVIEHHKKFPIYEWDKNKTYGTKRHKELIKLYRPSMYHRKSFSGVKEHCSGI